MRNPVPEKRVGLALLLIGGFALLLYIANSSATKQGDPATLLFLLAIVLLGWGLRERFKNWGMPPPPPRPPPKPAGGAPAAGAKPAAKGGGFSLPWGKKPAPPPPPPKPAAPSPAPAKPKGFLGKLDNAMKPKNKK